MKSKIPNPYNTNDIKSILIDFEKNIKTKGFKLAVENTVSEIDKVFEAKFVTLKDRIKLLENDLDAFRKINSQMEFMMNEKLSKN